METMKMENFVNHWCYKTGLTVYFTSATAGAVGNTGKKKKKKNVTCIWTITVK